MWGLIQSCGSLVNPYHPTHHMPSRDAGNSRPTHSYPIPPYPTLPYLTLPYPTLPYPTLPNPTLPHPVIPYPTMPYPTIPDPALPCRGPWSVRTHKPKSQIPNLVPQTPCNDWDCLFMFRNFLNPPPGFCGSRQQSFRNLRPCASRTWSDPTTI
jgi:hypothetical protein